MNDTTNSILTGVIGGTAAAGLSYLTDNYVEAFWPTATILVIASMIGMFFGMLAVPERIQNRGIVNSAVLLILGAVFGAITFVFWERHSFSPLIFGGTWAVVVGTAAAFGTNAMAADMKKRGLDNPCPKCGRELKYKGQGYAGYADNAGSYGQGTRTREYVSMFVCKKCGYEGPRA